MGSNTILAVSWIILSIMAGILKDAFTIALVNIIPSNGFRFVVVYVFPNEFDKPFRFHLQVVVHVFLVNSDRFTPTIAFNVVNCRFNSLLVFH